MAIPTPSDGPYAEIAAAGTTSATATALSADTCAITSGTSGAGVRAKAMNVNEERIIVNHSAVSEYFVYPPTGGKINNMTVDMGILLPPNRAVRLRAINNINVIAFF